MHHFALKIDEVEMMHLCRHKHICRLLEVFDGRDSVSMVMEEMKGGELFDRLVEVQEFTERDCAKQIRCIFQALAHMHSLGIVHRDLKPENLCYRDKDCTRLKVIDLGLSCYVDDCPPDACGTFEFLAPEQMLEKGYDERIDVFALGIITYVMMIGKSPFAVPKDELKAWDELHVWYRKMARTRITFGGNNTVSKAGQRFIKGCLAIDPEERLTAEQAANHEWFTADDSEGPRSRRHTLDATQLKKYQIMNRLKRGIRTMICLKRMAKLLLEENERYQRSKNRGPSATRLGETSARRIEAHPRRGWRKICQSDLSGRTAGRCPLRIYPFLREYRPSRPGGKAGVRTLMLPKTNIFRTSFSTLVITQTSPHLSARNRTDLI